MARNHTPPPRNGFGGSDPDPDEEMTYRGETYFRIATHHELTCPDLWLLVHSKTRIPLAVSTLGPDICLPTFTTRDRVDEFLGEARKSDPRDLTNFEPVLVRWARATEIACAAKLVLAIDFPLLKEGERP